MAGRLFLRSMLLVVVLAGATCGPTRLVGGSGTGAGANRAPRALDPNTGRAAPVVPRGPGVDLVPLHIAAWIFGAPTTDPVVQPGSSALTGAASAPDRLVVTALPSGSGTAAVDLVEFSPPGHRWGAVMIPFERSLFSAFASDPKLGDFLVLVDDVVILKGSDPVPITAYRWSRADVEAYAACGIPAREFDGCTKAFFLVPEMTLVSPSGIVRGA